ncbi:hypothetical protein [Nocardia sp. A7]|uniref:hypothetical protein n=1 Tax=Nocardia sp. A7 TaxID=2789274 RepID=UPI003977E850
MNPAVRQLIMSLVIYPGKSATISSEEFLRQVGAADGQELGLDLLREAIVEQNADSVELAFVVAGQFGVPPAGVDLLIQLANADWHHKHEDVAGFLQEMPNPASIEALVRLATWVPAYLEYDDGRALARKAVWALGAIPGPAAGAALTGLRQAESEFVRKQVDKQLDRRNSAK